MTNPAAAYRPARSAAAIEKAVGDARFSLARVAYRGGCYWLMIFDDRAAIYYETKSVYVPRLSDFTVARWVEDAKTFIAECHVAIRDRDEIIAENSIIRRMKPPKA